MNEHPAAFHDRWKKRGRAIDREWEEERDERMRGGNGRQRGRQGGEERERERESVRIAFGGFSVGGRNPVKGKDYE